MLRQVLRYSATKQQQRERHHDGEGDDRERLFVAVSVVFVLEVGTGSLGFFGRSFPGLLRFGDDVQQACAEEDASRQAVRETHQRLVRFERLDEEGQVREEVSEEKQHDGDRHFVSKTGSRSH